MEDIPPKKTEYLTQNQATTSEVKSFVRLRDERNSRHVVYSRDQLLFARKDNLNRGIYVTFNGRGNRSSKRRGVIVLADKPAHRIPVNTIIVFLERGERTMRYQFDIDRENQCGFHPRQ